MIVTELSVNAKSINIFKYNYFPSFLGCLKMKNLRTLKIRTLKTLANCIRS